jgi:hypothetical protein
MADGAMPCRKLFDFSFAPLSLSIGDLRALGARVAEAGSTGPFAIVVGSELAHETAEIFHDLPQVRAWLYELA